MRLEEYFECMVERTAIGKRDSDGVRVISEEERIPYLYQWVRDYVDKRKVTDGMTVLKAVVSETDDGVDKLTMNAECASDRAKREAERVDTIVLADL